MTNVSIDVVPVGQTCLKKRKKKETRKEQALKKINGKCLNRIEYNWMIFVQNAMFKESIIFKKSHKYEKFNGILLLLYPLINVLYTLYNEWSFENSFVFSKICCYSLFFFYVLCYFFLFGFCFFGKKNKK